MLENLKARRRKKRKIFLGLRKKVKKSDDLTQWNMKEVSATNCSRKYDKNDMAINSACFIEIRKSYYYILFLFKM